RPDVAPDFLLQLLFHAYNSVSDAFDRHRREEGITTNQSRILAFLYDVAGASASEIARATYLGSGAAEDAVRALTGDGLAIKGLDGKFALTETGRARREALARHFDAFEAEEIAGLSAEDIAATKRVLRALSRGASGEAGE
ncbi:MAG: MarR family winged helix-turn-helix transcriptional regulator, partial [Rhizobiaceae bacterium]